MTLSRVEVLSKRNNSQFKKFFIQYLLYSKCLIHVKRILISVLCQKNGEYSHVWNRQSEILGFNSSSDVRNIIWVNCFFFQSFDFFVCKIIFKDISYSLEFSLSEINFLFNIQSGAWPILVGKHLFDPLAPFLSFGISTQFSHKWCDLRQSPKLCLIFPTHLKKLLFLPDQTIFQMK